MSSTSFPTKQSKIKLLRPYILEMAIYAFVILLLSAGTYWRNKIWNSDMELWTDCVKKSPNKDRPHLRLGAIFVRQGKYQEALAQFTEALRINPDYAEAHANVGAVLIFQRKYQEAFAQFTEALRIKPNYAEAHYELGTAYLAMGDRDSALRECEILKSKNPRLADALNRGIK